MIRTHPVSLRFVLGLAVGSVTCGTPLASQEATQGASAASVVESLSIVKDTDLDFGTLIPNGTGVGRVQINANTGARNTNANVTTVGTDGFKRAEFTVTGRARTTVNLTTSSPQIILNGPGAPMMVDRLRVNRNNGGQQTLPRAFQLSDNGTIDVGFGGRLNVASNQATGLYSGNFDLIVTYQ